MNMLARFDENSPVTFADIKEKNVADRQKDEKTNRKYENSKHKHIQFEGV